MSRGMPVRRQGVKLRFSDALGSEMLVNVLSFCSAHDLARIECVSKVFREKSIAASARQEGAASAERLSVASQAAKISCERVQWRRLLYHFEGPWMDWKVQLCFLETMSPHGIIQGYRWPFVDLDADLSPAPLGRSQPRPRARQSLPSWDSDSEPEELDEDFGTKGQQVRSMLHFAEKVAEKQVSHADLLEERQDQIAQRKLHELSDDALELLVAEEDARIIELAVLGRDACLLRRALKAGGNPNALINCDPSDPRLLDAVTGDSERLPALFCAIDMRPPNYEAIKLLLLAGAHHSFTGDSCLSSAFDCPDVRELTREAGEAGVREHSALFFAASGGLAWGQSFGGEENRPLAKALCVRVLLDHGVRADQTHRVAPPRRPRHSWLDADADADEDEDEEDEDEEEEGEEYQDDDEEEEDEGEKEEGGEEKGGRGEWRETALRGLVRKLAVWAGERRPGRQWLQAVTLRFCPLFLELLRAPDMPLSEGKDEGGSARLSEQDRKWVPPWVFRLAAQ